MNIAHPLKALHDSHSFMATTTHGQSVDLGPMVNTVITMRKRIAEAPGDPTCPSERQDAWDAFNSGIKMGMEQAVFDLCGIDELVRFQRHCDDVSRFLTSSSGETTA